jgi:hypothetical protein
VHRPTARDELVNDRSDQTIAPLQGRIDQRPGPGSTARVPPRLPEAGRALVTHPRPMRDDEGAPERRGDSRLLHCRRCGVLGYMHRSRTRGWERPIRLLSLKRTFRCHACGRRSWLGPWRERRAPAAAPRQIAGAGRAPLDRRHPRDERRLRRRRPGGRQPLDAGANGSEGPHGLPPPLTGFEVVQLPH